MEPLAAALRSTRDAGRRLVVPYVLVDRARRRGLSALAGALADAGAAALELGFPFSDPIADGPTLETASGRALEHGTAWDDLLEQVEVASARLPTAVMTYANPVWAHGLDRALGALHRAGASGLIVPDLSLEESGPWRRASARASMGLVLLATPAASPSRIARIARSSSGFLYLVSRFGTTGARRPMAPGELAPLVRAAKRSASRLPVLIGFGIRDPATARAAVASGADGVVIGSALEERLANGGEPARVGRWVAGISRAIGASLPPGSRQPRA